MARSTINAWREILAQVFTGLDVKYNVTPSWLINPETNRRLKIDLLYPEIGAAIRFSGLRGSQQKGRQSLDELAQQQKRDQARLELCEAHDVSLADLNIAKSEPDEVFKNLESALSRATRRLDKIEVLSAEEKMIRKEKLFEVRGKVMRLRRKIRTERDLSVYYDLWRDRQYREAERPSMPKIAEPAPVLAEGMLVEHVNFGVGIVQALTTGQTGDDGLVTIHFESGEEKQFMAKLLGGKVTIL